jgi:protein arginine N-methyltransferase 1
MTLVLTATVIVVLFVIRNDFKCFVWLDRWLRVPIIRPFIEAQTISDWGKGCFDRVSHYTYQTDTVRNIPYQKALSKHVKNKIVLDIGTGPGAFWAIKAAEAGAKHVYGVEVIDKQYQRACRAAQAYKNVTILKGASNEMTQELMNNKPADVLIHEIIGEIAGCEGVYSSIKHAKQHLLIKNPIIIPDRVISTIAATEELRPNKLTQLWGRFWYRNQMKCLRDTYANDCHFYEINNYPKALMMSDNFVFEDIHATNAMDTHQVREQKITITRKANWSGFIISIKILFDDGDVIDAFKDKTNWAPVYVRMTEEPISLEMGDVIFLKTSIDYSTEIPAYTFETTIATDNSQFHRRLTYNQSIHN